MKVILGLEEGHINSKYLLNLFNREKWFRIWYYDLCPLILTQITAFDLRNIVTCDSQNIFPVTSQKFTFTKISQGIRTGLVLYVADLSR